MTLYSDVACRGDDDRSAAFASALAGIFSADAEGLVRSLFLFPCSPVPVPVCSHRLHAWLCSSALAAAVTNAPLLRAWLPNLVSSVPLLRSSALHSVGTILEVTATRVPPAPPGGTSRL
jgi:hypothetical protein